MARMPFLPLAVACALAFPAGASAASYSVVQGAPAPGPSKYDKVFVEKVGPSKAGTVLVLMPGTISGAGQFSFVARDLVERVPGLQVWNVDRRGNALEDTSMLRAALTGRATRQQAFDYYLGWLADSSISPHYQPLDAARFPFVRDWGLKVMLEDTRRVVLSAKRRGKRVILGGHSLGASATAAYAAWDFGGRPGYRDIAGMVLIDGGLKGAFNSITTLSAARDALAKLRASSPFTDLIGVGLPWAAGVFAHIGGLYALQAPEEPSAVQQFPLLPAEFRPPVRATNAAAFGYALDDTTSPGSLELIHFRAGRLADSGDPRPWVDGEVTPIARAARIFASQAPNLVEWYYPRRLNIDTDAAMSMERNAVTKYLGLRLWHTRKVDRPLYAFQTDLTNGRVLRGARRFMSASRIPRRHSRLVDRSRRTSHLDPVTAAPERNDFVKTVVPFLKRLTR